MVIRKPLTQADADKLPLNTTMRLGGISFHTSWIGGDGYFTSSRYGFARDNSGEATTEALVDSDGVTVLRTKYEPANDLEAKYNTANSASVTFPTFCQALTKGWRFFSATGLDYVEQGSYGNFRPTPNAPEDFYGNVYETYSSWAYRERPAQLHYLLCAMTNTRRSDGRYALYKETETAELGQDLAFLNGSGTLVFAIDGSGSFADGADAINYMTSVLHAYIGATGNNTRLIVTKFSDDYSHEGDLYDGVVIGDYPTISASTIALASERISKFATGNGGDSNETQIMGIYVGLDRAKNLPGPKAVIVYTDAASVIPMPPNLMAPPLRQRQRDDGLATDPRHQRGNGTSQQTSLRRGGRVYY